MYLQRQGVCKCTVTVWWSYTVHGCIEMNDFINLTLV